MILRLFELYIDFSGRMNRKHYILNILGVFCLLPLSLYLVECDFLHEVLSFIVCLFGLLVFISYLSIIIPNINNAIANVNPVPVINTYLNIKILTILFKPRKNEFFHKLNILYIIPIYFYFKYKIMDTRDILLIIKTFYFKFKC